MSDVELIPLREWCKRTHTPLGSGYHLSADRRICGLHKVGNRVLVDWRAFLEGSRVSQPKVEAA